MRILIFNTNYYPNISGGAEISTQLLAETLYTLGNDVWVCTIADSEKRELVNGVNVVYTNYRNVYWAFEGTRSKWKKSIWHVLDIYNIRFAGFLRKLIDEIKPDVIHTNNISGFSCIVWHLAKSMGIPVVHTLRDYYLLCYKTTMYKESRVCDKQCLECKLYSVIPKQLSHNVSAVVGISRFILDKHLAKGYFAKCRCMNVIYNSVEVSQHPVRTRDRVIGYLGSIIPSKGVERLIADFSRLNPSGFVLEICGTGDDKYIDYLKNKYRNLNIRFLGRVKPENFLTRIALLVVPSEWHEPFGRVVVESILYGCPVIVSNRGGMPGLITKETGRVFNNDDENGLYNYLQDYVDGRLKFSLNFDRKCFKKEFVVAKYLEIYKNIKVFSQNP